MIETIGAELVDSIEEAHTATHVIASDGKTKLRRTPKVSFSVTLTWLVFFTPLLTSSKAYDMHVQSFSNFEHGMARAISKGAEGLGYR